MKSVAPPIGHQVLIGRLGHTAWCTHVGNLSSPCNCGADQVAEAQVTAGKLLHVEYVFRDALRQIAARDSEPGAQLIARAALERCPEQQL
jgi:hypothetical protein